MVNNFLIKDACVYEKKRNKRKRESTEVSSGLTG